MPTMMDWTLNSELKPFLPQAAIIRVFYYSSSERKHRGTVLRAAKTSQTATRLNLTLHVTNLYLLGHLAFLSPWDLPAAVQDREKTENCMQKEKEVQLMWEEVEQYTALPSCPRGAWLSHSFCSACAIELQQPYFPNKSWGQVWAPGLFIRQSKAFKVPVSEQRDCVEDLLLIRCAQRKPCKTGAWHSNWASGSKQSQDISSEGERALVQLDMSLQEENSPESPPAFIIYLFICHLFCLFKKLQPKPTKFGLPREIRQRKDKNFASHRMDNRSRRRRDSQGWR